jgi:hypothetical protein
VLNDGTGALTSLSRVICSGSIMSDATAILLSSWATVRAPTSVELIPGRAMTQASATCAAGRPIPAATAFSSSRMSQLRSANLLVPNGFAPLSRPESAVLLRSNVPL